jgi:hypothetical protein
MYQKTQHGLRYDLISKLTFALEDNAGPEVVADKQYYIYT